MAKSFIQIGFLACFAIVAGCSQNVKVTGKVTFEDGTPLTMGRVCFQTETMFADGPLKEDGTYTLGSLGENTGLPKGTYQVFISGATTPPQLGAGMGMNPGGGPGASTIGSYTPGTPLINKKFTDRMTSELTCEVSGKTEYNITVTPP